jgi:hypothetical protein
MAKRDKQREAKLNACDDEYFKNAEPIAESLSAMAELFAYTIALGEATSS